MSKLIKGFIKLFVKIVIDISGDFDFPTSHWFENNIVGL